MTIATLSRRQRKVQKALTGPQAIPVNVDAVNRLQLAANVVEEAWRLLDADGRHQDCQQLDRFINDLRYRLLPRVRSVACTHCMGYRTDDTDVPGTRCTHNGTPAGVR